MSTELSQLALCRPLLTVALSGCCFLPSVPHWESLVSFGSRSCSASDSADSLARVEIMWKKTDCKSD